MMAKKKRRRRRVDEAKSADTPTPPQTSAAEAARVEADEDEEEVEGVMMPPMPSELGVDAVMTAQVRKRWAGRRAKSVELSSR